MRAGLSKGEAMAHALNAAGLRPSDAPIRTEQKAAMKR
jgi:hypothetical protein